MELEYNSNTGLSTIRQMYGILIILHKSDSQGKKFIVKTKPKFPSISLGLTMFTLCAGVSILLNISLVSSRTSNPSFVKDSIMSGSHMLPYL